MSKLITHNPFTEKVAGKHFVGRDEQLNLVLGSLDALKNGEPNHLFLSGIHGTGKTSFLVRVLEIAKSHGLLPVFSTLDNEKSGYEHIHSIIRSVVESLQENLTKTSNHNFLKDFEKEKPDFFKYPQSKSLNSDVIKADFITLKNLISSQGKKGVMICIDEGQRIEPSALSALKNSIQHIDFYSIIISLRISDDSEGVEKAGRAILDEKAKKGEGDFGASRMFINCIEIGPFKTDREALDCIEKRLNNNEIQFHKNVMDDIISICEKIPREIINLCSNLYNRAKNENVKVLDKHSFYKFTKEIYNDDFSYVENVCSILSSTESNILKVLHEKDNICARKIAQILYPSINDNETIGALTNVTETNLNRLKDEFGIVVTNEKSGSVAKPCV